MIEKVFLSIAAKCSTARFGDNQPRFSTSWHARRSARL
jgi:hypothetical protein